jgi:hypothetical protein
MVMPTDDDDVREQDSDRCENRFCQNRGVGHDDDGRFLCEDCWAEWAADLEEIAKAEGIDFDED